MEIERRVADEKSLGSAPDLPEPVCEDPEDDKFLACVLYIFSLCRVVIRRGAPENSSSVCTTMASRD